MGLYRPSAVGRHLEELAQLKLESLRFREPISVLLREGAGQRSIGISPARDVHSRIRDRESPRELASLVDRLSNRLGSHAVVRPGLLAGTAARVCFHDRPLSSLTERRRKAGPAAGRGAAARVDLWRSSFAVGTRAGGAGRRFGRPRVRRCSFDSRARRRSILHAWGPERIEPAGRAGNACGTITR